jgi:hypothetical protein
VKKLKEKKVVKKKKKNKKKKQKPSETKKKKKLCTNNVCGWSLGCIDADDDNGNVDDGEAKHQHWMERNHICVSTINATIANSNNACSK